MGREANLQKPYMPRGGARESTVERSVCLIRQVSVNMDDK